MIFSPGTAVQLGLALEDGATGLFPRAYVYANGVVLTSVDLDDVGSGRYSGSWTPGSLTNYDVLYRIFTDAGRTTESAVYSREMERWQSDGLVSAAVWDELLSLHTGAGTAGEFLGRLTAARAANIDDTNVRMRLVEKIMRNRLELSDGDSTNWVLYDDDSVTPLLTWDVSDKDGDIIQMNKYVPARRTRGA